MNYKLDSQGYILRGGTNIIKWGIISQTVYEEVAEGDVYKRQVSLTLMSPLLFNLSLPPLSCALTDSIHLAWHN